MVARPYTEEGFPLPTIAEWNSFVAEIQKTIADNGKNSPRPAVFRGAVDDLDSPDCRQCGAEVIRQSMGQTAHFVAGVVYCHPGLSGEKHPMEYWIEVWPHGGRGVAAWQMSDKEAGEVLFRLSKPLIRNCYSGSAVWWHQHVGLAGEGDDFGLTYFSKPRTPGLPEPGYTHKR